MGGVPVLLLFAAIGVTYGWQPDGGGGVEYIIQVPADQLDRLQESGEVTSVIDPQVQGHVSRIVIRVGNQRLPRETPSAISQLRHEVPVTNGGTNSAIVETQTRRDRNLNAFDASDQQPIPIPQMTANSQVQPIPGLHAAQNKLAGNPAGITSQAESMMKPDASNPAAGPGFSFPSSAIPKSLQEAAGNTAANVRDGLNDAARDLGSSTRGELDAAMTRATQKAEESAAGMVDRAGNALRKGFDFGAANGSSGNNNPADAARTPEANRFEVPSFTGSDAPGTNSASRSLAGGPSTVPTNSRDMVLGRDKDWQDLNQMNARSQTNMAGGPSTDPVGSSSTDNRAASTQFTQPRTTNTTNTGLGTTSTFGRPPDALNTTTAAQQRAAQERAAQERAAQEGAARDRLAHERAVQEQQAAYQRQQANANTPSNAPASPTYPYGQSSPFPGGGQSSNFANAGANDPNGRTYGQSFPNDGTAASAITNANADPRLSTTDAAKLPPNGWSYNAYGRPIDREGNELDSYGRIIPTQYTNTTRLADQSAGNTTPPPRAPAGYDSNANAVGANTAGANPPPRNPGNAGGSGSGQTFTSQNRNNAEDVGSPSDLGRRYTDAEAREAALAADRAEYSRNVAPAKTVAAQPLFNGLLLISIVGNVYLAFWLKNLRHQFHDLVAAKRMSQNSGASVV
ncbi:hypothetical protein SH528x_005758 [Novipirellula sp. SH528]|uniref:hypothetical protein n=1 Tax=Novipirellula sp. SH528 TaxID=3454466 RepID=UPI003FA11B44